ncbi:MAG: beta-glucosidase, partial [Treponema sp.]|nr:beta-glucosidase [Treponema sp.]
MTRNDFPKNFLWGAATASFQIEGSPEGDGRGNCIWDTFCSTPGKVQDGDTGKLACDHYRRYQEDVELMAELGIKTYRFSLAWSRVLPDGYGAVNQKGIDFYKRLIDALLTKNIQPAVTLYHWDLPQRLQDAGGWASRDTCEYFRDYANLAFEHFGDKVPFWYTHNEPWCVAFAGNLQGRHAPGNQNLGTAVAVSHHLLLSHGMAVDAYRTSKAKGGNIGIVLNLYPTVPASLHEADKAAADLSDKYQNRWFLDPLYRGAYPADLRRDFEKAGAPVPEKPGDLSYIAEQKTDFLGVNYYFRKILRAATQDECARGRTPHPTLPIVEVIPENVRLTDMGWEVYPQGLTDLLKRLKADYEDPRIVITENGVACSDTALVKNQPYAVDDEDRRSFIEEHLAASLKAIEEGVQLTGYYVWSL